VADEPSSSFVEQPRARVVGEASHTPANPLSDDGPDPLGRSIVVAAELRGGRAREDGGDFPPPTSGSSEVNASKVPVIIVVEFSNEFS